MHSMVRKTAKDHVYVSIDSKLEVRAGNYAFWFFIFELSLRVVYDTGYCIDKNIRKKLYQMKYSENKSAKHWTCRRHIEWLLWVAYG